MTGLTRDAGVFRRALQITATGLVVLAVGGCGPNGTASPDATSSSAAPSVMATASPTSSLDLGERMDAELYPETVDGWKLLFSVGVPFYESPDKTGLIGVADLLVGGEHAQETLTAAGGVETLPGIFCDSTYNEGGFRCLGATPGTRVWTMLDQNNNLSADELAAWTRAFLDVVPDA